MEYGRAGAYASAHEIKYAPLDLKQVDAQGQFEGYASLFDLPDMERDSVVSGAFASSLRKRGIFGIKMLFQHDPAEVIGIWQDIHEDARGLYVRGQLLLDVAKAKEVHSLMKSGALDGLSIGFRTLQSHKDRQNRIRQLTEVDLWEISVVTFPMQPEARIAAVKSQTDDILKPDAMALVNVIHKAAQTLRQASLHTPF